MKIRILLSIFILTTFSLSSIGQIEFEMLSPKSMKKDLSHLMKTIDAHPDPYAKISEAEFQAIVKEVEENISQELDEIDFYKNISKLVASIRDGHSSVYMPESWLKKVRKENGVFPYEVFLSNDGELHVIKSYGDKQIQLGAQILEINNMSVDAFVDAVTPYISYETIPFRNDRISEQFELMLYLVFKQVDQVSIKYKVVKDVEVLVSTMEYKEWRKQKKDLKEVREKKIALGSPYEFTILEPGIAKIDIFSFKADIEKYNLFLSKTFKQIKKNKIHSLIIDVRGNYGGWPKIASELFHYIHEGSFKTMAKSSMKVSEAYRSYFASRNPQLSRLVSTPGADVTIQRRRHFLDLEAILLGEPGTYANASVFFNESPITEDFEFFGDCYVLIDRKSYSASSSFASTFQCYNMGYLIGEPTGGTKVFRANAFVRTLPKTNFIARMSTTKFYTACFDEENAPVEPNVLVVPTILDRVHDVDPQLNTALMLIKKIQKEKKKGE